jgi:hypothetical protein
MTKAEGFLTKSKKHLELQETSRTLTIVLSCLRVLIDSSRMRDHARSLAARVQERNRFPTALALLPLLHRFAVLIPEHHIIIPTLLVESGRKRIHLLPFLAEFHVGAP